MTNDDITGGTSPQKPRQSLPRSARIRARRDFDRVFQKKNRASDALMTVYMARNEVGLARLGIAASRRLGNAVTRNRVKRLVRESFRRGQARLPAGTDWVVVPRQPLACLWQVDDSLWPLIERLLQLSQRPVGRSPAP